jgi:hypothetical protein
MSSGQMSSGQMSSGQMSLGKCLWVNVSRQMSYGQMLGHRLEQLRGRRRAAVCLLLRCCDGCQECPSLRTLNRTHHSRASTTGCPASRPLPIVWSGVRFDKLIFSGMLSTRRLISSLSENYVTPCKANLRSRVMGLHHWQCRDGGVQ